MKTVELIEFNDVEGEVFSSIIEVNEGQLKSLIEWVEKFADENNTGGRFELKQDVQYTDRDLKMIEYGGIGNSYSNRIGKYELIREIDMDDDCFFYKRGSLNSID